MPHLAARVSSFNKKKINPAKNLESNCTCRDKANCPSKDTCNTEDVLYVATVKAEEKTHTYTGVTSNSFKSRIKNHEQNFKSLNPKMQNKTTLSTFICNLKKKNIEFTVDWEIVRQVPSYKAGSDKCNLCIAEVAQIFFKKELATLNNKEEIFNTCRHRARPKLSRA